MTTTATSATRRPADARDSLSFFRVALGGLVFVSLGRFVVRGWVRDFYIAPRYFFSYYGFDWVRPLPGWAMYAVFGGLLLAAALVALGAWYRPAMAALFAGFTYVELIDKTTYLNHYYFLSLLLLLGCGLPLNAAWSADAARQPGGAGHFGPPPAVALNLLRLQVGLVYFFAGVAKLKTSWLLEAQPLRIWLASYGSLPLVGGLLEQKWVAFAGSWFGAAFDLTIPFWLLWRRSRPSAYAVLVLFHLLTAALFYIGQFPWIMMLAATIFFEPATHQRALRAALALWRKLFGIRWDVGTDQASHRPEPIFVPLRTKKPATKTLFYLFAVLFFFQLLLPFRYLAYPGDVLWTEQGFRFGWNVMLMEKTGLVEYTVRESGTGRTFTANPAEFLTPPQLRMLATQPDMVLQFAHFLAAEYRRRGVRQPQVFAECYANLNGRGSRLLLDPTVDLAQQREGFGTKSWILSNAK